jgi:hypothetical protein
MDARSQAAPPIAAPAPPLVYSISPVLAMSAGAQGLTAGLSIGMPRARHFR